MLEAAFAQSPAPNQIDVPVCEHFIQIIVSRHLLRHLSAVSLNPKDLQTIPKSAQQPSAPDSVGLKYF